MRQIVWESHIILITFAGWKKPVSLFIRHWLGIYEVRSDGDYFSGYRCSMSVQKHDDFADKVMIETTVKKFSGIKLILQYEMKNEVGKMVVLAESADCFLDKDGKMLRLAK